MDWINGIKDLHSANNLLGDLVDDIISGEIDSQKEIPNQIATAQKELESAKKCFLEAGAKMVKARFREEVVSDGDVIELEGNISALTIHADQNRLKNENHNLKTVVTWLEEVKE